MTEQTTPIKGEETHIETTTDDDFVEVVTERKLSEEEKISKARAEARQYRKRFETIQKETAEDKAKMQAEFNAKIEEKERIFKDRALMAELKLHAMKANVIDTDVLKLLDKSQAKFDDSGEVINAAEIIENFRTAKPHLFSSQTSVAANAPKPKSPDVGQALNWKNMSAEEKRLQLKALGITEK